MIYVLHYKQMIEKVDDPRAKGKRVDDPSATDKRVPRP
jgi:hypothetical protein